MKIEFKLKYLIFSLIFIYLVILIKTAWLSDDAYITFRTIDNFINGFGLRWNIAERVQSYTHPLWLFLLSGFYAVTHEIYYTCIFLSIIISLLFIFLISLKISVNEKNSIVIILMLISSKAFIDYSTSGLENPLTHLLIAIFAFIYLKKDFSTENVLKLSLITSLITINRMDTLIILIPALLSILYEARKLKVLYSMTLGFLPFLAWEVFSLIYYGYPFPNTAYAKLNTDISSLTLAKQGVSYFMNSLKFDPVTLPAITAGLILPVVVKNKKLVILSIGIILYLIYIIKIGGDFMSGRFFTPVFITAVIIISCIEIKSLLITSAAAIVIVILGFVSPYPNMLSNMNYGINRNSENKIGKDGVADERAVYYEATGFLRAIKKIERGLALIGKFYGKQVREQKEKLIVGGPIGIFGYYAGPSVHILDTWALNEPLLARLPTGKYWRIGHFPREVPEGYCETLIYGKNFLKNKYLAEYYVKMSIITRDELFSFKRMDAIIKMNSGCFNYLIKNYLKSKKK